MSYNRTLLYSNDSSVSSCTLSESTANFRRLQILLQGCKRSIVEIPSFINKSNQVIVSNETYWENDTYNIKALNISIDEAGTKLTVNGYNLIGTQSSSPHYWGNDFNNSANITVINKVFGVDRINYVEEQGIGSPGIGWRKYNEKLLWSGTNTGVINLSESASSFERLRLKLGTNTSSQIFIEVDAPLYDGYILTTNTTVTESPSIYRFAWSNWIWTNNCKTLTSVYGKSFRNTYKYNGNFTNSLDNSDIDINKRPILEIVGINRLETLT